MAFKYNHSKYCIITWVLLALLSLPAALCGQHQADSVTVTIQINSYYPGEARIDSAIIFFDKYDHSGPGVIVKKLYANGNVFTVEKVPAGRYFIGIICLGLHEQFFSKVSFVNKRRSNHLEFSMKPASKKYWRKQRHLSTVI